MEEEFGIFRVILKVPKCHHVNTALLRRIYEPLTLTLASGSCCNQAKMRSVDSRAVNIQYKVGTFLLYIDKCKRHDTLMICDVIDRYSILQ